MKFDEKKYSKYLKFNIRETSEFLTISNEQYWRYKLGKLLLYAVRNSCPENVS